MTILDQPEAGTLPQTRSQRIERILRELDAISLYPKDGWPTPIEGIARRLGTEASSLLRTRWCDSCEQFAAVPGSPYCDGCADERTDWERRQRERELHDDLMLGGGPR